MAIKGVNLTKIHKFVSETDPDRGTDREAVFLFKSLDAFQVAYLNDALMGFEQVGTSGQDAKVNMGKVALLAVQMSLDSAENFLHPETGEDIVLKRVKRTVSGRPYQLISEEIMSMFPGALLQEMYQFLAVENGMTASEAKKSASP